MSGGSWRNTVTPTRGVLQEMEERLEARAGTQLQVQALDEVMSVNALFTVAVFIGISYTTGAGGASGGTGSGGECDASGPDTARALLVLEVVAFACYLFSSLMAHALKLLFLIIHSQSPSRAGLLLRLGMLASALGTIVGTLFLTLSIALLVQLRLRSLRCAASSSYSSHSSAWSYAAIVPLVLLVSLGLIVFISTAFFSFFATT